MSTGIERIAAAFTATDGRAAFMPYLMGGFPDLDASRAIGEAYADGGADLVELGVPFSDPLADGPVIHEAGSRALAAGVRTGDVLEVARGLAEEISREPRTLEAVERAYIIKVLRQVNGNKSEAAKILGITRQTLRKKLTEATP